MPQEDRSVSTLRLTAYYVTGLLLIGCTSIASHTVQQRSLQNNRGFAATINLSGRQRMLSQRIAGLVAEYRLGDPTARVELQESIDEMQAGHEKLATPYLAGSGLGPSERRLHSIYFEQPLVLDSQVRHFLATAREVTLSPATDPDLPARLSVLAAAARSPLLNALDQVVTLYQQEADQRLAQLARLDRFLLGVMILTLGLESQLIFRPMVDKVSNYSRKLLTLTNTDQLTGVDNRRGFNLRCRAECDRVSRYGQRLCVLALDIDSFKRVNDTYGHPAGDTVLQTLGGTLRHSLRPSDVLARVGGEEFTILLPQTGLADAVLLAERLRISISTLNITHQQLTLTITVSIGVAEVLSGAEDIAPALEVADQMLYQAKQSGRNRVVWQHELVVLATV